MYALQLIGTTSLFVVVAYGLPNPSKESEGVPGMNINALDYLRRNGYYQTPQGESASGLNSDEQVKKAITSLQRFAGIPPTGELDEATKVLIETPRCGLPDKLKNEGLRKRRYTLQGSRWETQTKLTWRLKNDNDDGLTRTEVEGVLSQAFGKWSTITNMDFQKLQREYQGEADIEVRFVNGYHDDPYPFDGPGGTLAHAFYPHNNLGLSGDVHFDDAETFTLGKDGRNLLWVATHEIGHSLGLEHSSVQAAVMYPWYKKFDGDDFDLNSDDILGVQQLYGSRSNPRPPTIAPPTKVTKSTTTPKEITPGCTGVFKAVFLDRDTKNTHIVNKDKVYTLDEKLKLSREGPKDLQSMFSQVDEADAVYTDRDGRITFFKGTKYYQYESVSRRNLIGEGYIFHRFRGIPNTVKRIDAAFNWERNKKTYIFVGDEYYRYDEYYNNIDPNYPRKINSAWHGIPNDLDSVFEWTNGATYFFKDGKYYRLNNKHVKVEPNYPKSITQVWTKCHGELTGGIDKNSGHLVAVSKSTILLVTMVSLFMVKVFL